MGEGERLQQTISCQHSRSGPDDVEQADESRIEAKLTLKISLAGVHVKFLTNFVGGGVAKRSNHYYNPA